MNTQKKYGRKMGKMKKIRQEEEKLGRMKLKEKISVTGEG